MLLESTTVIQNYVSILEVHSNWESATPPDKKDTWCSCKIFGYRVSADGTDDFHLTHVAPKQRSRQWRTESVNCGEMVLPFFPPAFKILRL